ncbi:5-oxoprolinase subunit B family protein (plasmid) [Rhizobium leguminosarum]
MLLDVTSFQRSFPIFKPVGDRGVLVEFGENIDQAVHTSVLRFDRALTSRPFVGFIETVPAYAAVLIRFDPLVCDHSFAEEAARRLLDGGENVKSQPGRHEVLVCYDTDFAPDLQIVADTTGLGSEQVIEAHLSGQYDVFMYGFAPGYAYLAGVPNKIRIPRKPAAIRDVPAGSVLIAGPQCLVSTITMPTGWWIIGRSPTPILTEDPDHPFLFDVGDRVQFRMITRAEFDAEVGR